MSEQKPSSNPRNGLRFLPWLLTLGAFLLYGITGIRELVPGLPARIVSSVLGLDPIPNTTHQLYTLAAKLSVWVWPGSELAALNLVSAVCAALCVAAVYQLMLRAPFSVAGQGDRKERHKKAAQRVAAVLSVLCLAVSFPFWLAASRPGSFTFDILILLACFLLVARFNDKIRSKGHLFGAVFLYGLGITEYAGMITMAPFFALYLLIVLLRRGQLTAAMLLQIIASVFAGLLFYLVSPLVLRHTVDYGYGQYDSFFQVIVGVWKQQYREIKSFTPRVGGLLIVLSSFVPWLYALFMTRTRHGNQMLTELSIVTSLLLLTGLGATILMEYRFSPYKVLQGTPFIVPYISIASWLGYLGGYWYLYSRPGVALGAGRSSLGRWMAWLSLTACFLCPPAIAARGFPAFARPTVPSVEHYAKHIAASLDDAHVFFSAGGMLDDMLRFFARDKQDQLLIVSTPLLRHPFYVRYLENALGSTALANIDVNNQAAVAKAIVQSTDGPEQCAFARPEMVFSMGQQYVPIGLVVRPTDDLSGESIEAIKDGNRHLFDDVFSPFLKNLMALEKREPWQQFALQEYSRCANNVGTTLLLLKDYAGAETFYERALAYFSDNPSAQLNMRNLYVMKAAELPKDSAEAKALRETAGAYLERAYSSVQKAGVTSQDPLAMASLYGETYSDQGALQAAERFRLAGRHDLQGAALERARLISPDSMAVRQQAAAFAVQEGRSAQAVQEYRSILAADPSNVSALTGLAVTYYSLGRVDEAIAVLSRPEVAQDHIRVESLLSLLQWETGNVAACRALFDQAVLVQEKDTQSLGFLAMSAFRLKEYALMRTLAEQALAKEPTLTHMTQLLIWAEKNDGNYDRALALLESQLKREPQNIAVLQEILSLNMGLANDIRAKEIADELLRIDPDSFIAHFSFSSLATKAEQFDLAETHLRACMKSPEDPNYPIAVNNLAFCLLEQGKNEEALEYARRAVDLAPSKDTFHHTLATARLRNKQYEEAEKEILLALTLAPDSEKHKLVHAEILFAQGHEEEARALATEILPALDGKWRNRAKALLP